MNLPPRDLCKYFHISSSITIRVRIWPCSVKFNGDSFQSCRENISHSYSRSQRGSDFIKSIITAFVPVSIILQCSSGPYKNPLYHSLPAFICRRIAEVKALNLPFSVYPMLSLLSALALKY